MAGLTMNKRWLTASLATCAFNAMLFAAPESQANLASMPQTTLAQSSCAAADRSRSAPPFRCVTPKAFSCLKRNNAGGGGSLEYRGDTNGEIVVKSNVVGTVALLGFNFNASSGTLDLNVKKRNFGVRDQQIWDGFKNTLSKCR